MSTKVITSSNPNSNNNVQINNNESYPNHNFNIERHKAPEEVFQLVNRFDSLKNSFFNSSTINNNNKNDFSGNIFNSAKVNWPELLSKFSTLSGQLKLLQHTIKNCYDLSEFVTIPK